MDVGNTWEYGNRTGFPSNLLAEPIDVRVTAWHQHDLNPRYLVILVIVLFLLGGEQASGPRELTREVDEGIQEGDRGRASGGAGPDAATHGDAASGRALQEPARNRLEPLPPQRDAHGPGP